MEDVRYFVVSDLHGDGIMYYQIIHYLENLWNNYHGKIILYIIGDVVDRGPDSMNILFDIMKRSIAHRGKILVQLLAGNHEYMMYEALKFRLRFGKWNPLSDWFYSSNGGKETAAIIDDLNSSTQKEILHFLGSLPIYYKFSEKLDDESVLLVHAKAPKIVKEPCHLFLNKGSHIQIYNSLWSRRDDFFANICFGRKGFFTIIGHTPVDNKYGFCYERKDNILNIDGGCAAYVIGFTDHYDHAPLVEIDFKNQRLIILTFNHNNEIIYGKYFRNKVMTSVKDEEMLEVCKLLKRGKK